MVYNIASTKSISSNSLNNANSVKDYDIFMINNNEKSSTPINNSLLNNKKDFKDQKEQKDQGEQSEEQKQQEQKDQEQIEQEQKEQEEREQAEKEQQASEEDAAPLDEEEQQALEQWLRRVPDDPGGLLRQKFQQQYDQRIREGELKTNETTTDW